MGFKTDTVESFVQLHCGCFPFLLVQDVVIVSRSPNTCQGRVLPTAVSSLIESGAEPLCSLMASAYQQPDADQMLDDLKPVGRLRGSKLAATSRAREDKTQTYGPTIKKKKLDCHNLFFLPSLPAR